MINITPNKIPITNHHCLYLKRMLKMAMMLGTSQIQAGISSQRTAETAVAENENRIQLY
ncbi:hypothetical protein QWY97_11950 [Vibrio cortegadensis]|nr:hypothetical protein [Vibrio cortegadensis]